MRGWEGEGGEDPEGLEEGGGGKGVQGGMGGVRRYMSKHPAVRCIC